MYIYIYTYICISATSALASLEPCTTKKHFKDKQQSLSLSLSPSNPTWKGNPFQLVLLFVIEATHPARHFSQLKLRALALQFLHSCGLTIDAKEQNAGFKLLLLIWDCPPCRPSWRCTVVYFGPSTHVPTTSKVYFNLHVQ